MSEQPRYDVRNPQIEKQLKEIGTMLREGILPGYGFALLIFSFEPGELFYVSNAEREGMIATMKEFIARNTQ